MQEYVLRTVLGVHLVRKSIGLGLFPLAFLFSPAIPVVHGALSSLARIDAVLALVALIAGSLIATYLLAGVIGTIVLVARFPSKKTDIEPYLTRFKGMEACVKNALKGNTLISMLAYMSALMLFLSQRTAFGFLVLMPAALAFENHNLIRKVLGKQ